MTDQELIQLLKKFISHDLVAPLANNKSYFSLLKTRELSTEERNQIIIKIEENNLLALSMIAQIKEELKRDQVQTSSFLK